MGSGARPAPRRYPKPPAFIARLIWLCLRPESWAEAARYPTSITLLPLLVIILLGAGAASAGQTVRQMRQLQAFSASYDAHYPAMELSSEGVLSAKGELKAPVRVPALWFDILVDPTGKTNPETVPWDHTLALITDKQVVRVVSLPDKLSYEPIADFGGAPYSFLHLPAKGQATVINGKSIGAYIDDKMPAVVVGAFFWAGLQALGESAWVTIMVLTLCPLVMVVAAARIQSGSGEGVASRGLILPRRAAYRMVAGFMVPLVLVSATLRSMGHPITDVLGWNGGMLFWLLASIALAIWTGVMARRMYGAKRG